MHKPETELIGSRTRMYATYIHDALTPDLPHERTTTNSNMTKRKTALPYTRVSPPRLHKVIVRHD